MMMELLVAGDATTTTTTRLGRALQLTSLLSNSSLSCYGSKWSASVLNAVVKASPHQVCQEVEFRHSNDELLLKTIHKLHNVVYISPWTDYDWQSNHTKRCRWFHPFENNITHLQVGVHCFVQHISNPVMFSVAARIQTLLSTTHSLQPTRRLCFSTPFASSSSSRHWSIRLCHILAFRKNPLLVTSVSPTNLSFSFSWAIKP